MISKSLKDGKCRVSVANIANERSGVSSVSSSERSEGVCFFLGDTITFTSAFFGRWTELLRSSRDRQYYIDNVFLVPYHSILTIHSFIFNRERNREHAKRSRIRKKFLLESLQQSVTLLKEENEKLRKSIRQHLGDNEANHLLEKENLAQAAAASTSLIASNSKDANKVLDDPDFSFIKALQTAQQNFVVTDPSLPDNPIVYATQGFLNLTGYTLDQVLGRNCRFLQGPETDPKAVEKIRRSIEEGSDMSVCLLNYRADGTTFWNQFFIAALRDAAGNITNYVGVQCKVSDQYAANVCKKQDEEFAQAEAQAQAGDAVKSEPMTTDSLNVAAAVAAPAVPMKMEEASNP